MFKACIAALRYLAGVKIASEADLRSLRNGTFSLGLRWSQEVLIALPMFMALKLKLHAGDVVVRFFFAGSS